MQHPFIFDWHNLWSDKLTCFISLALIENGGTAERSNSKRFHRKKTWSPGCSWLHTGRLLPRRLLFASHFPFSLFYTFSFTKVSSLLLIATYRFSVLLKTRLKKPLSSKDFSLDSILFAFHFLLAVPLLQTCSHSSAIHLENSFKTDTVT